MALVTVYVLYFNDIRMIAFTKKADPVFFVLTLISIFLYTLEIVLSCIAIEGYLPSFFFWVDIVSTLTMVPDCGWIWSPMINKGDDLLTEIRTVDIASITRTARITRVIRILRLMSLFRIVKLYKQVR